VDNGFAARSTLQVGERPTPNGWFVGSFLLPGNFRKDDGVYSVRPPSIFARGSEDQAALQGYACWRAMPAWTRPQWESPGR
jgi:hypothetical protein